MLSGLLACERTGKLKWQVPFAHDTPTRFSATRKTAQNTGAAGQRPHWSWWHIGQIFLQLQSVDCNLRIYPAVTSKSHFDITKPLASVIA